MTSSPGETTGIYATPTEKIDPSDCAFYHTMEVPGYGLFEGEWDLRPAVDAYLGGVDFDGKRVLELGTADGYLSFHIEKQGGEVVSYDLSGDGRLDLVPFARTRHIEVGEDTQLAFKDLLRRLNNAYWLCHRAFESNARLVHGNVYTVPQEIGPVDVSVFGSILLHTRDPFRALVPAVELTRETVVVTDALGYLHVPSLRRLRRLLPRQLQWPAMSFIPDWRTSEGPEGWWRLSPELVQAFLGVLGFERSTVRTHFQMYRGRRRRLFTVVASRCVPFEHVADGG